MNCLPYFKNFLLLISQGKVKTAVQDLVWQVVNLLLNITAVKFVRFTQIMGDWESVLSFHLLYKKLALLNT